MELKLTQKAVLKVLVEHKNEHLGIEDIKNICNVNRGNIKQAITFFLSKDLVYQPNSEGKVMVSPNGISEYYNQ